ncbi:MAG: DUF4230 domain-containing protein [Bacteroidales bacterium]|nr:DUF4230 domain-containing protein [Bacteroidales bacterium]
MNAKLPIGKWLLAACLTALLTQGCGPKTDPEVEVAKLFNQKKLDLVDYKVRKVLSFEDNTNILQFKFGSRKLLLSCVADVKAGLDFDAFNAETDISVDKNLGSVSIKLPAPSITSFVIDVNNINDEYNVTTGVRREFKQEEKNMIVDHGREEIEKAIPELGILEDARENAVKRFTSLVEQLGFSHVNITFADETEK